MKPQHRTDALVDDELDVLAGLVPIAGRDIVELGCGAAGLARSLLARHPDSQLTGLEVDERQHAKNLASLQPGLHFFAGGAQAIPFPDASFDLALMLAFSPGTVPLVPDRGPSSGTSRTSLPAVDGGTE